MKLLVAMVLAAVSLSVPVLRAQQRWERSGEIDPMTDRESKRVVLRESEGRTTVLMVVCDDGKDLNVLVGIGSGIFRPDGRVGPTLTSPVKVRFDKHPPETTFLVFRPGNALAGVYKSDVILRRLATSRTLVVELALLDGNK